MSEAALAEPSRHDAGGSALHGRAGVLVLVGAEAGASASVVIHAFAGARGLFEAQNAAVACVVGDARTRVPQGLAVVEDAALIARCGIGARDILVLLRDRQGRVLLALEPEEGVDPVAACLGCLKRLGGPSDADPKPLIRAMAEPLAVGNRAPACFGMTADRRFYSSEEQYGRPAVLILADAAAEVGPVLSALGAVLPAIAACGADVLLVTQGNPARLAAMVSAPVRVVDAGDFLSRCGMAAVRLMPACVDTKRPAATHVAATHVMVAEGPPSTTFAVTDDEIVNRGFSPATTNGFSPKSTPSQFSINLLLLDRNQRIMLTRPVDDAAAALADCLSCLSALPREAPRQIDAPVPAIMLPHLLSPEMCRHLIALFDSLPVADSGVARVDSAGRVGNVVDRAKKRRRDMLIEPGTALHKALRDALLGRCRGEIAKAF